MSRLDEAPVRSVRWVVEDVEGETDFSILGSEQFPEKRQLLVSVYTLGEFRLRGFLGDPFCTTRKNIC